MKKRLSLLILSSLIVVGCSSQRLATREMNVRLDDKDIIESQLLGTAKEVEASLRNLAQSQYTPPPPAMKTGPLVTPQGNMGRPVTIDWSGPIEPFLNKIGNLSNYKVKVFGPTPSIPILVSVHASNELMADVIKNASLQLGHRADVVVYPTDKIIELRYQTM